MSKTTNLYVRLEPELKEQAELVLGKLGIPMSNAVNMFLKQIVMQRGIPFDIKLPTRKPVGMADLTEEELNTELEEGYEDFSKGNIKSVDKVFSDIYEDYGI
ncbi:type II toxin-antitoxin system RelB/DinJ family antitoxin [Paratissierella segnis]|jgi:DNA-damage-inducible protein J|uniref:Type II toxin-antitoxin system RelB/DinJ family antitoxin n=1 Tax=Paratissierella segnis TaxID=2763679 RepID=A0A926ILT9_9FIRM|nr:type II toxin-antitoxin system RelB/DinJ family antitoxin [Paratissierella segnis]MBC8588988.1 type II toxin-antitoxin system RelB/DinJ family antitoxin [Paratissierella segnis]